MGRNQLKKATDYIVESDQTLKRKDVASIVRSLHNKWNCTGAPTIDIDASVYVWKFLERANGPVNELAEFVTAWAATGVDVTCVLDPLGGLRDDTKRATIKRRSERFAKQLKALQAKAKRMRLGHFLQTLLQTEVIELAKPDIDDEKAENLKQNNIIKAAKTRAAMLKQEKIIKAAETSTIAAIMKDDLYDLLEEALANVERPPGCGKISVAVAQTQADSTIAYRLLHGISQAVISTDMDFGHLCGERCLEVDCKFSASRKNNVDALYDITVSSPSLETIGILPQVIGRPGLEIHTPPFPIFDNPSLWWRATMAVAIGCDQCPGGVKGVNVAQISNWLRDTSNVTIDAFLDYLANFNKRDKQSWSRDSFGCLRSGNRFRTGNLGGKTFSQRKIPCARTTYSTLKVMYVTDNTNIRIIIMAQISSRL